MVRDLLLECPEPLRTCAPNVGGEGEGAMKKFSLFASALFATGATLLSADISSAQTAAPSCAWNKYLYAQDAVKQGKIDVNLLNQMSALVAKQGYSMTNKVWQLCNGWLMEAKRGNGSTGLIYVEPKTQTIVDIDFTS
jgi:hypothetical protein